MTSFFNLYAEERKNKILLMIEENQRVTVPELVELFGVSGTTIRNDLRELENEGKLLRTHGGAVSIGQKSSEDKPDVRKNERFKVEIAEKALQHINEGDTIIIDAGTTCLALAYALAKKNMNNVKVITNDIKIAEVLEDAENIEIILLGGTVRKHFHYTYGYQAIKFIKEFSVDKVFMGTTAFSFVKGLTTPNIDTADIKEAMLEVSRQIFVLCDESKIGTTSFKQFAKINNIDMLITNNNINPEIAEKLKQANIPFI